MKFLTFIIWILFHINYSESVTNQNGLVSFIQSFVLHLKYRPGIETFLCYDTETLIEIQKSVNTGIKFNHLEKFNSTTFRLNGKTLFIIDSECNGAKRLLESPEIEKLFNTSTQWLILTETMEKLEKFQALPNSNLLIAKVFKQYAEVNLTHVYRVEYNSSLIYEPYGTWSQSQGLRIIQNDHILSRRRRNLLGKTLTSSVVILHNDTFNHLYDHKDVHVDPLSKVNFLLVNYLIESVNGTKKFKYVPTWGYKDPKTGILGDGMVKNLIDKEADIGGTPLLITHERLKFLDYMSMTTRTRAMFIFREPPLSYVTNIYYLPFSSTVWICSGILVTLCVTIIFITNKVEVKLQKNNEELQPKQKFRLTDYILLAISVICQMGSSIQPKITSARISTIFFFIALLFLYTSYTANIVALLQSTSKTIQTKEDFLKSPIKLGAEDNPYMRFYLAQTTDPIEQEIYKRKIINSKGQKNFLNASRGVQLIRNDFFGFYIEVSGAYKIIKDTFYEHEKCNLREVEYLSYLLDPWLPIQKNSPYKEMLKVNLLKIREHGLQNREQNKIYTTKPVCSAKGQNFGSVRLTDCYAAIIIFLIGCGLSLIMLLLEHLIKNNPLCKI